jgi:hypothetical protein
MDTHQGARKANPRLEHLFFLKRLRFRKLFQNPMLFPLNRNFD